MQNLKRLLIASTVVLLSFTAVRATDVSGSRRESTDSTKPSLYVLAIGICKYRNYHRRNPAYACKDARDFGTTIEQVANKNFEKINMKVLVDDDANEASIESAMKDIIVHAKSEDTFIFFYSGHGESEGIGGNEQFYLVPSNFNRLKHHRLRTHAISASKLQFWFLKVESQHQFVILDSHKSTRGFQEFKNQIDRENQILKPLVQRDVAILSIRSISFEFSSLRNGLLTYLTLQGLNGKAASDTGAVTVKSLIDYVNANWLSVLKAQRSRKVQENIRRFPDAGQPDSYFSGDDFALSARANQDRALAANHHSKFALTGRQTTARYPPNPQCTASAITRPGTNIANRRGKDFALLIGTNNYEHHDTLSNPIRDAEALAEELNKRFGFETEVLRDVSADCITDALYRYGLNRTYPNPDDQLFIFFAGHGTYKKYLDEGFLIAKDSPRVDPDGRKLYAHSLIKKLVDNIPCNHIFLVLNACFSGTIDKRVRQEPDTAAIGMTNQYEVGNVNGPQVIDMVDPEESCNFITRKMQRRTRHVMTSGQNEPVPDGPPGGHSPFTSMLLTALRELSLDRSYLYTSQIYCRMTTVVPEPYWTTWGHDDPSSEFFFFSGECKNEN